ncbi:MIP family Ig-specific serine endopeptidase [Mycoplasma sp. OR1901]|uniref:MIP family Ig-specific serine endopeptidase n=1 Tax=Mycoplasma sp. OR1901 TaxID=2742195 RepID=UPI0015842C6C|nr:DUF31 family protein [Mycoplasma sp. OR1901]QKT05714.1 hypothetical protein HTZ87_03365 [Mycoplasma sp. OR1901]
MKKKILLSMITTTLLPTIGVVSCSQNKYETKKIDTNTDINNTKNDSVIDKVENTESDSTNGNNSSNEDSTINDKISNDTSSNASNTYDGTGKSTEGSSEGGTTENNTQPKIPTFPDADFFRNLSKKNHQYSVDVSKFDKTEASDIYKEIYDRTFSVKFGVNLEKNNDSFLASSAGTTWLLDYHKEDENKYKLFFATNLHVIGMLSNTLDNSIAETLNYVDERGFEANSISIGKSNVPIKDFSPKNNNFPYGGYEDYKATWLTNNEYFTNREKSDEDASRTTKATEGAISKPKLIFAGYDFIKHEYIDKYQEDAKRKTQEKLDSLANTSYDPDDKSSEVWALNNTLKNNKYIPFYTDFAVFEIDVDFTKMTSNYAEWFKNAIKALDKYIERNSKNITPNQDKSISKYMLTTDYITAEKQTGTDNLKNSKNIYIGGYPAYESSFSSWSQNNPVERNSDETWYNRAPKNSEAFGLPSRSYEEKMTNNNFSPYTTVFGKTLADFYGFIHSIHFSSLYYGASGSVVYNEFGQIIGAYSGVSSKVKYGDLSSISSFTPLLLSEDYTLNNNTIKAYNLIDGTDKTKYEGQIASYRENLRKIYPSGFGNGKKDTALFTEGF